MSAREPHPELARLRAAHRRVHRPAPELRAQVARALAADRERERAASRREQAWRWIGGSLVGAAMGVAALLAMHWIAVGIATRAPAGRTPDAAEYGSPRTAAPAPTQPRRTSTSPVPAPTPPGDVPPGSTALSQPLTPVAGATAEPTPAAKRSSLPTEPPTASPDLAAEVRLLREAEVALSRDPAQALAFLRAHARTFPRTSLPLERRALEILARCAEDPGDAAIRERDAFLREHPGSPYAARVRAACR